MNDLAKIKEKYVQDTETMASKSRFGYFSVLPSHTAAHTDFPHQPPKRNSDGKVITQPRNIYSGITSSPSLQKNYFNYTPSPFHGSAYIDPGKIERKQQQELSKQFEGKERFKPAKLNKTLMSASYSYMPPYDIKKDPKNRRDADGKVITQQPNIQCSPQSKISYNRSKEFTYTECPPQIKSNKPTDSLDKEQQPFKTGNTHKEVFSSHLQTYFDADIKKPQQKKSLMKSASHDAPFKPSCIFKGQSFTPVVYVEEGSGKPQVAKVQKKQNKVQPFKLIKVEHNSKPCPSISLSKVNLLRVCR